MNNKIRSILIAIGCFIVNIAFCQQALSTRNDFSESYAVNFITMGEGLPHNFVDDIFRDSKGYLWFATSASLSRYDGYEFISFNPNSSTRHIKSSFVRKVAEDRFGRLWAASDGGIDIIRLSDLTIFLPVDTTEGLLEEISYIPSSSVCMDKDGNIWIRNVSEIVCVMFDDKGAISRILTIPHNMKMTVATAVVKAVPELTTGILTAIDGQVCALHISDSQKIKKISFPRI